MRRFVFSFAVVLAVACGDATGPEAVTGSYALRSVNGKAVPSVILTWTWSEAVVDPDDAVLVESTLELVSGVLQLNTDSTFGVSYVFRGTEVRIAWTGDILNTTYSSYTEMQSGTFTMTGSSLQLTSSNGNVDTASRSGDVLTMTIDGIAWVWER